MTTKLGRPRWLRLVGGALALLLGACAVLPPAALTGSGAPERLARLLAESDEAYLDRNPLDGLWRGDLRRAAQHGDYLSPAFVTAERNAAAEDLRRLASIARDELPAADRLAYDTFAWRRRIALRRHEEPLAQIWPRLPLDQFDGWHLWFAQLSSGDGAAPYKTVDDFEHGLARIDGFVEWLDRSVVRMREGLALGIVQPRFVALHLVTQFDRFIAHTIDDSPYSGPVRKMPATFSPQQRERYTRAYAAALNDRLRPALQRTRDFLAAEYLPRARGSVGLSQLPGGAAWYQFLIEFHTTTRLAPSEINRLGESEVVRITGGMEAVKERVGFRGPLAQFLQQVRDDPRLRSVSAQAQGDAYRDIGRRVDAAMPRLFAAMPRTPLEIRPTPDYMAPTAAEALYESGSLDIGRPGVFYYNTHDLAARPTLNMETLYLHEAVPGHHFQISLANENTTLPKLLRFDGNTAFAEGWALYAESLGPELGLFQDPYQLLGHYSDEMLRAMRLVVDTGLHALGWSREQAIEYMLAHSALSRNDVVVEVERYIVYPGQALAYKIGQLTIRRLRNRAEQALGARFDIRAFHDQILSTGALPLDVLEAKIDGWIARGAR